MGFNRGPYFVGWSASPTPQGELWRITPMGLLLEAVKTVPGGYSSIHFLDAIYWSAADALYIVGYQVYTSNSNRVGIIWKYDGSSFTQEADYNVGTPSSDHSVVSITEFGGELYAARKGSVGGGANGGYIVRKQTPAGSWSNVLSMPSTYGPRIVRADNGYILAVNQLGSSLESNPPYYYSTTGNIGEWTASTVVPGGPPPSQTNPHYLFWDSINSVWRLGCYDWTGGKEYTGPITGPTGGVARTLVSQKSSGEIGQNAAGTEWYFQPNDDLQSEKWDGTSWTTWYAGVQFPDAIAHGPRNAIRLWGGDVYNPNYHRGAKTSRYYKNGSPVATFPGTATTDRNISAFVPISEEIWDILDIGPGDWDEGPFCNETTTGSVTSGDGSSLVIRGDSGLSTISSYDLQFGPTCALFPDDIDTQIEMTLTSLPTLFDLAGPRIVLWLYFGTAERKVTLSLSEQGVAVFGLDSYADLDAASNIIFSEGDDLFLKITVKTSDDKERAYISINKDGRFYKLGFASYDKENGGGAPDRIHIETVGTPERPATVSVTGLRVRTHEYVEGDPDSMDDTKPVAEIA